MKIPQQITIPAVSTQNERKKLLSCFVLSVSGWRLCFAGHPDSIDPSISPVQRDLVALAAAVFAQFLRRQSRSGNVTLVVGTDTRPTGPAIADTAMRVFLAAGLKIEWLGVVASPEIMAYTKKTAHADGFFYITASHNPPGYNGFKFGLSDGAVVGGELAAPIIEAFRDRVPLQEEVENEIQRISLVAPDEMRKIEEKRPTLKNASARAYRDFVLSLAAGTSAGPDEDTAREMKSFVIPLRQGLLESPLGVVGELNGSARTTSIDRSLLPWLGVRTALYNDKPGTFAHQILPEGPGLDPAAQLLRKHHKDDPAFQVAYVPDNDGDRGNLVFTDAKGNPTVLEAQQVFALTAMIELAWLRYRGGKTENAAIVVNGPTSIRVEDIARWFGASLFRAEVGEANVVALAQQKLEEGWIVPLTGEGSNGGSIVLPSTVRDPLSTIMALLKLHAFPLAEIIRAARSDAGESEPASAPGTTSEPAPGTTPEPEPASTPGTAPGTTSGTAPAPAPADKDSPWRSLLQTAQLIPRYITTQTDDPLAKMQVGPVTAGALKARYEELLPNGLTRLLPLLEKELGVTTWELWNYEGTRAIRGPGNRTGTETGGLKLLFLDSGQRPRASLWMRGSGTEPVFRVMADCAGENADLAATMIQWQREHVQAALDSL